MSNGVSSRLGRKCVPRAAGMVDEGAPVPVRHEPAAVPSAPEGARQHVLAWKLDKDAIAAGTLRIRAGDRVVWHIDPYHTVTSGKGTYDGRFTSGTPDTRPRVFEHVFRQPGVYPYFCSSHTGAMRAAITVVSADTSNAGAGGDPGFELTYQGLGSGVFNPLRFETALRAEYIVFDQLGLTLAQCKATCAGTTACKGIFYYFKAHRCRGLSYLGHAGVSTKINANSYTKKLS